jgi:hypothetical protein
MVVKHRGKRASPPLPCPRKSPLSSQHSRKNCGSRVFKEKLGCRLPSTTKDPLLRSRSSGPCTKDRTLKLKIDMKYDKYQFFSVETDGGVKK